MRMYGAGALSAVLLACSFEPIGWGFLAYVALVPLFWWMRDQTPRRVFRLTVISGILFHLLTLSWIRHITWGGMIVAVLALSLVYALPFLCTVLAIRRWPQSGLFLLPFAVAGIEWVRSFDVLAFPWMILGNSQTGYPWLIQFADITSGFGVSAWVVLVNVLVWRLIEQHSTRRGVALALAFAAPFAYSMYVIQSCPTGGEELTIALVQGNVYPDEKWEYGREDWNINLYRAMSAEAALQEPDLIVWPETATPVYLCEQPRYLRMVRTLVDSIGIPVLTGTPSVDLMAEKKWNSACLLEPYDPVAQKYDKMHLVPFGEAIPFDNMFPSLKSIELGQANWDEGNEVMVFEPEHLPPFNVAICFESIFPDLTRQFIREGSQYLVVITNDVWFGPWASPIQHAMISVMRAIEFHRPVARCANTGISLFIDSCGRITSRTGTFERDILTGTIRPQEHLTFYARWGNIFSVFSLALTVLVTACSVIRSPKGALRQ